MTLSLFISPLKYLSFRIFLALTSAILFAGCSDSSYPSAAGKVTFQGQPLANATVVFALDPPEAGVSPATAITEADGTFRLQMNLPNGKTKMGVRLGTYKVTVSKFVLPKGITEAEYNKKVEASQDPKRPYTPTSDVPEKVELIAKDYSNQASTKLTAKVENSGKNEFNFEIP